MFELTQNKQQKLREWFDVCNKLIFEKQKNEMSKEEFILKTGNGMYPYFGAIGGNYKYSFTPNSIGHRMYKYKIQPEFAGLIAAGMYCRDAISSKVINSAQVRPWIS